MFKTLLKFLLPALGGSGIVVLTMHLTNTSGNLFNSLHLLNIKEKPDIDEEELIPQVEPQPAESQQSEEQASDDSSEQTSNQESPSTDSSDENAQQSTPSSTDTSGAATLEDVIRDCAQIIDSQTPVWTGENGSKSLLNIYKIESTINRFINAIKQQASQNTTVE